MHQNKSANNLRQPTEFLNDSTSNMLVTAKISNNTRQLFTNKSIHIQPSQVSQSKAEVRKKRVHKLFS